MKTNNETIAMQRVRVNETIKMWAEDINNELILTIKFHKSAVFPLCSSLLAPVSFFSQYHLIHLSITTYN